MSSFFMLSRIFYVQSVKKLKAAQMDTVFLVINIEVPNVRIIGSSLFFISFSVNN